VAAVAEPVARQQRPETDLEERSLTWAGQAQQAALIRDQQGYARACELLLAVKDLLSEAASIHDPAIAAAHASHKAALSAKAKVTAPLTDAERILKSAIGRYDQEQKRIALEAERRALEEAERQQAELLEQQIERAEAQGADAEEVEAIINRPQIVPKPVLPVPSHAPVAGVVTSKSYRAVVTDLRKLCRAVADGVVSHSLVLANESALNTMARSLKGVMQIPGVSVEEIANVRAGGRG
jgi:hypothetical protein